MAVTKDFLEGVREHVESDIDGWDIEKIEAKLRVRAKLVSDLTDIISDCDENLMTVAKMEDVKESTELKKRMKDAMDNRAIYRVHVEVMTGKLKQLRRDRALGICGPDPKVPGGMDMLTFGAILDHIYDHTESVLIGDQNTPEGKKMKKQVDAIIKSNPKLKDWVKS